MCCIMGDAKGNEGTYTLSKPKGTEKNPSLREAKLKNQVNRKYGKTSIAFSPLSKEPRSGMSS